MKPFTVPAGSSIRVNYILIKDTTILARARLGLYLKDVDVDSVDIPNSDIAKVYVTGKLVRKQTAVCCWSIVQCGRPKEPRLREISIVNSIVGKLVAYFGERIEAYMADWKEAPSFTTCGKVK